MEQLLEEMPCSAALRPNFETVYSVGLSFLRQALRWLGVAEWDLDDVLQDVMLAAFRGLDCFDPQRVPRSADDGAPQDEPDQVARSPGVADALADPLRRWLFGIAWRQVGHYRGRAYRRREVAVGAGVSWPFDPADPGPSSDQILALEEQSQLVGRLLGTLDLDRSIVLIMYELLDMSITDIAQELGLKENTVRNRLRLAREDFRVAVKRMNAEQRRALRASLTLSVAELFRRADERSLMRAARAIPDVPTHIRLRIWAALERTLAPSHGSDANARAEAVTSM